MAITPIERSVVLQRLAWKQRLVETEVAHVADAHRIEDAVQMIDLVLDHAA